MRSMLKPYFYRLFYVHKCRVFKLHIKYKNARINFIEIIGMLITAELYLTYHSYFLMAIKLESKQRFCTQKLKWKIVVFMFLKMKYDYKCLLRSLITFLLVVTLFYEYFSKCARSVHMIALRKTFRPLIRRIRIFLSFPKLFFIGKP